MYHLAKITSRKHETEIITFYFKINLFQDYQKDIETHFLTTLNNPPFSSMLSKTFELDRLIDVSLVLKFEEKD